MRRDTLKDPAVLRKSVWVLLSLSAGVLVSIAFGIIGSRGHYHPPFSGLHSPILQLIDRIDQQLESTIGVILTTLMFLAILVIRFQHKNAWLVAFLAGAGIGALLVRIVLRLV